MWLTEFRLLTKCLIKVPFLLQSDTQASAYVPGMKRGTIGPQLNCRVLLHLVTVKM